MTDTFTLTPAPEPVPDLAIYRAVADPQAFGMNDQGVLIAGLRLELVYEAGYDALAEEFENAGMDATLRIHLPPEGLIADRLYTPQVINEQRDWESGIVDEWDIELRPYHGEIPQPPPSVFNWDSPLPNKRNACTMQPIEGPLT
jgi:hypothetical protein